MIITLTENELKTVVASAARRVLEEGILGDLMKNRRAKKIRAGAEEDQLRRLEHILSRMGFENLVRDNQNGHDGFRFEADYVESFKKAKELSEMGVKVVPTETPGDRDYDDNGVLTVMRGFAYVEPWARRHI